MTEEEIACVHQDWNVYTEVSEIIEPPMAAGNFLVKITVSCPYCGMHLNAIDDGKVFPYLETVMFR